MVAYLLAVDLEQRDFVPAEERSSSSAANRAACGRRKKDYTARRLPGPPLAD
jgi:hypothetical protein